jgi:exodeoxyribonuclease V alpha subunit
VRQKIPSDVTTVHRLLGSRPGTRHFRHHAGNPLPLDVLVVDEASMIDLEMMANLLDALPPHARMVLLGDKDQLASVEAGAVLGDLCRDAEAGLVQPADQTVAGVGQWRRPEQKRLAGRVTTQGTHPLAQQVVMLRHSRRFGAGSGIGQLAKLVNQQQPDQALVAGGTATTRTCSRWRSRASRIGPWSDCCSMGHGDGPQGYRHYLACDACAASAGSHLRWTIRAASTGPERCCRRSMSFQLLCAVRKGPWGVEGLNQRITLTRCSSARLIESDQQWYEGRPVLMTRNDYGLGLMNGDIGIALKLPERAPEPAIVRPCAWRFRATTGSGGVRFVLPSRLNDVETVYAMTVHKSQGSEFAHTALILPEALNPVLTKELIYTGITRAKNWFSLIEPRRAYSKKRYGARSSA